MKSRDSTTKLSWTVSELVLHSRGTDNTETTDLLLRSADHTENKSRDSEVSLECDATAPARKFVYQTVA
jgi:hypothetical protein